MAKAEEGGITPQDAPGRQSVAVPLGGCARTGRAGPGDSPCRRGSGLYSGHQGEDTHMTLGSTLALVLLFAGVIILFKAVRMVPQGYEWTVEAFGKYTH